MGKPTINPKLYLMAFAIALLTQACFPEEQKAILNEMTLVKLLSEKEQVIRDTKTFLVSSCDGSASKQTTGCVAGTKNNFSLNLSAETKAGAGVGYKNIVGAELEGKVHFGADFGLDFSRESSHTIELTPPPAGQVYRYTITKEYTVKTGNASAVTASGKETTVQYRFQADCHCSDKKEVLTCEEAEKLKDSSSSITSTTSTTTTSTPTPKPAESEAKVDLKTAILGKWHMMEGPIAGNVVEFMPDGTIKTPGFNESYKFISDDHIQLDVIFIRWKFKVVLKGDLLMLVAEEVAGINVSKNNPPTIWSYRRVKSD